MCWHAPDDLASTHDDVASCWSFPDGDSRCMICSNHQGLDSCNQSSSRPANHFVGCSCLPNTCFDSRCFRWLLAYSCCDRFGDLPLSFVGQAHFADGSLFLDIIHLPRVIPYWYSLLPLLIVSMFVARSITGSGFMFVCNFHQIHLYHSSLSALASFSDIWAFQCSSRFVRYVHCVDHLQRNSHSRRWRRLAHCWMCLRAALE